MAEAAVFQIRLLEGRSVRRLKSWHQRVPSGLPAEVGATSSSPLRVLCIGPGDWLIVSDGSAVPHISARDAALVEMSEALLALEVSGSAVREVLSKGCGLDLHPRTFVPERCARTRLAQIPVVIDSRADPDRFELYVARSYYDYLLTWFADAAVEFQVSDLSQTR